MIDYFAEGVDLDAPVPAGWTPKVGDRVRVRLSGECDKGVHLDQQDGLVGTVVDHPPMYAAAWLDHYPDHLCLVQFDHRIVYDPGDGYGLVQQEGCGYTPHELEPA